MEEGRKIKLDLFFAKLTNETDTFTNPCLPEYDTKEPVNHPSPGVHQSSVDYKCLLSPSLPLFIQAELYQHIFLYSLCSDANTLLVERAT